MHIPSHNLPRALAVAGWLVLAACGGADTATPESGTAIPESGIATPESGAGTPETGSVTPESGTPPPESTITVPELLLIDGAHVARVRDSLRRGEPEFGQALTALEVDADSVLNMEPVSVMDKGVTPPSGDQHDYMSQAPYWWPDPSEADGKPYIRRDGERNPEIESITDRENLERVARSVSSLALASYFTGRQEYAQHAARLVRVWFLDADTRMDPHLQFGQGIPGIAEGRGEGIIETRFLLNIIDGVTLLQGSPAWTVSDDQALKDWMRAYLQWLVESPRGADVADRDNNQETWYDLQIVALALYTGQTEVARTTLEAAQAEIGEQFRPDGSQPHELERTRAWDYSIFNLTAFLHLARLGEPLDVDLWNFRTPDGSSLQQGVEYLVPFATGERHFPDEQITEFDPSELHPVLRWAAVGWNEPRYRELALQIGGGTSTLELTVP
ncbi:MAG TPA: alginate lyase family protein [Woeseiaceae bacterium]|nr:alginate lyase family protein [Woeseiaceae bacterium]